MIDAIPDWIIWVLLIFAAGVIGQFGKALATRFLDQFKSEEPQPETVSANPEVNSETEPARVESAHSAKEQKKLDKAEAKRAKKETKTKAKASD